MNDPERKPQDLPADQRILLSHPTRKHEHDFLQSARRSEGLHHPWVFAPLTHEDYESYLERIACGRTIGFLLLHRSDEQMVGVVNVSEPVWGALQGAYLGFYVFAGFERQGYMTEGLSLVLDQAFEVIGFHRLEANIQPSNVSSSALVSGLGFRKEGFSPRYLQIGGVWRDHDRWAILSDEWPEQRRRLFARISGNKRQSQNV